MTLAAIHQGKNVWFTGVSYRTCSETFATLSAAKCYLDSIYDELKRAHWHSTLNNGAGQ